VTKKPFSGVNKKFVILVLGWAGLAAALVSVISWSVATVAAQEEKAARQAQAAVQERGARQAAIDATNVLINLLHSSAGSDARTFAKAILNSGLDDFVAFDAIARSVMGKYANSANSDQRKKFADSFRISLVNFYSRSLLALDEEAREAQKRGRLDFCVLSDSHLQRRTASSQIERRSASVDLIFGYATSGVRDGVRSSACSKSPFPPPSYKVTYRMVKMVNADKSGKDADKSGKDTVMSADQDGAWKIRNITLEGLNVLFQFRSQFASAVAAHNGDAKPLDKVIDEWGSLVDTNGPSDSGRQKKSS